MPRTLKNIIPVLQTTATDCGLACMVMVLQAHGSRINLEGLRKRVPPTAQGVSVVQLLAVANAHGLFGRAVRVDLDVIGDLQLPAIIHWNFNHYVILEKLEQGQASIIDPARGRLRISFKELSNHLTGIAVEFRKLPSFATVTQLVRVSFSDLWSQLHGWRSSTALVFAISILIQLGIIAAPLFLSVIVDQAIALRSFSLLEAILIAMVGAQLVVLAGELVRKYLLLSLGTSLIAQLNLNLVNHLLRLPYLFFQQSRLNDLLVRVDTMRDVKDFLTENAVPLSIDGLFSVIILFLVAYLSPSLALTLFFFYLVFACTKVHSYKKLRVLSELAQDRQAEERAQIVDTLRGIQTVKVLNAESTRLSTWHSADVVALEAVQRKLRYETMMKSVGNAMAALELIAITGVAAAMVIDGAITVGLLFSLIALRQQFRERAYPLIERLLEYKLLQARLQRLASIVTSAKEYEDADAGRIDVADVSIEIRNLHFAYGDKQTLYRDLNLSIPQGSFVAIKGRSGLGKSTLIRILLGLIAPHGGEILIGKVALNTATIASFRSIAAAVMQDDQLFGGTLFDNISAFDPNSSVERVYRAARLACIHDEIEQMPAGYFAQVGDMGSSLSGGQRQRILLARALYRMPRILLLDEGTANLDLASEAAIIDNLRGLGITIVCVAHRARALEVADAVYELSDGRLIYSGGTAHLSHGVLARVAC